MTGLVETGYPNHGCDLLQCPSEATGVQRPFNHGNGNPMHDLATGSRALAYVAHLKRSCNYLKCYAITDPNCNAKTGK